jgi:phosphatidylserine/phosphatidylglycerophosphate/cardiolipin synthase-like enzyme
MLALRWGTLMDGMTPVDDWFLEPHERGNAWSSIDAHDGRSWTDGNMVTPLVDGAPYFARLAAVFDEMRSGDLLLFTDWRGDADERLVGDLSVTRALVALCRRGIDVRGLVWRSHSDRLSFSAKENRRLANEVVGAGGEVLLDERVRPAGSHHQKLVVARHPGRPDRDVAFVGGIDLCHGRRDDGRHRGDPQSAKLDPRFGDRPPWHDVQLEVRGPAVADLELTFRERWSDPSPLDHSGVVRAWFSRTASRERTTRPLPPPLPAPPAAGSLAVQVLRTYPARRPSYDFAPDGERSVARAFLKAVARARSLVYIEDQYFWSVDAARAIAAAVRRQRDLRVIVVVPRHPDRDGLLSGRPARHAQARALDIIRRAAPERVAAYDLENEVGTPVYVHAKVCVIDDTWVTVGSDNVNRRSWSHDSEVSCAVVDATSNGCAGNLRRSLWSEHLAVESDHPDLQDAERAFDLWQGTAHRLEEWHGHRRGERPGGRVRVHVPNTPGAVSRLASTILYRTLLDPDGRPISKRRAGRY